MPVYNHTWKVPAPFSLYWFTVSESQLCVKKPLVTGNHPHIGPLEDKTQSFIFSEIILPNWTIPLCQDFEPDVYESNHCVKVKSHFEVRKQALGTYEDVAC